MTECPADERGKKLFQKLLYFIALMCYYTEAPKRRLKQYYIFVEDKQHDYH